MALIIKFPQIDLNGVKGVLMDLDNTLYAYERCHWKAMRGCYAQYVKFLNNKMSFMDFSRFYRRGRDCVTQRLYPQGACRSRLFAFQMMFEEINGDSSWALAKEYDDIYWGAFIDNMRIVKKAKVFLENCKERHINLCIVSDMISSIQIRKLQKLQIARYVKYLVTSEEVGVEKPNPEIFKVALKKMNFSIKDVIMIGDSESQDIQGAENLGIKAYKVLVGDK